ncbi:MAG: hypothetical protein ACJA0E_001562 [Bermanella sp.]|jgi:hypothetical protein
MNNIIHQRIEEALKIMVPFAIQADEVLDQLKQDQKGNFSAIFPKDSFFKTVSTRFLPYMEELNADLKLLPEDVQEPAFEPLLTDIMNKLETMQQVLNSFHELREYDEEKVKPT